jgi:hypothetical protein
MLGMALLGAAGPLLAAPPRRLDRELAAIAADPACELASLSVLAIRAGQVSYSYQFGRRFIGHDGLPDKPVGSKMASSIWMWTSPAISVLCCAIRIIPAS